MKIDNFVITFRQLETKFMWISVHEHEAVFACWWEKLATESEWVGEKNDKFMMQFESHISNLQRTATIALFRSTVFCYLFLSVFFFCSNQHDLKCNWLNKPLQWSEIILFTALVFVQEWIQLVLEPSLFTCQLENWFFRNFTRLSSFYPNFILSKAPPKNPKNPQRRNLHDSENLPNFHPHTLYKDLHFKARPVTVRNRP